MRPVVRALPLLAYYCCCWCATSVLASSKPKSTSTDDSDTSTATSSSSSSSSSASSSTAGASEASDNGYDAVMCGENGYADGSGYSYSADAWNAQGDGFQCLSVINASSTTTAGFDATWHWPTDPDAVHSYPHVTFSSPDLPAPVQNLTSLRLAAEWAMAAGTLTRATRLQQVDAQAQAQQVDTSGLNDVGAVANVAFDMFLDVDADNATSATAAAYEMMIWIGRVGDPYPLGYDETNATCYTQQLGSYNFTLYSGQNARGTSVFTWVSPSDQTSFAEDISPLFQYLWRHDLMVADAQLGLVEFGSEAYHSGNNVTFSAAGFGMGVWPGDPPRYELNAVGDGCHAPTSPTTSGGAPTATGRLLGGGKGGGGVVMMALWAAGWASSLMMVGQGQDAGILACVFGTALLWRFSLV